VSSAAEVPPLAVAVRGFGGLRAPFSPAGMTTFSGSGPCAGFSDAGCSRFASRSAFDFFA
jgi:hypothetical protein